MRIRILFPQRKLRREHPPPRLAALLGIQLIRLVNIQLPFAVAALDKRSFGSRRPLSRFRHTPNSHPALHRTGNQPPPTPSFVRRGLPVRRSPLLTKEGVGGGS